MNPSKSQIDDSLSNISVGSKRYLWVLIAGIIFSIIGVWLTRAVWFAREAARQSMCQGHLNQLAMAFYNYHDVYGSFPPAYVVDSAGNPMHSWRVLILPFIDQRDLYEQYDFSEPWNGPRNSRLKFPYHLFHCPSGKLSTDSPITEYVVVTGAKTPFPGSGVTTIEDFKDGLENTILLVEITNSDIHWMEPRDLDFNSMSFQINDPDRPSISAPHSLGPLVIFADGISGYRIHHSLRPETLQGLLTISGKEGIDREELISKTTGFHRHLAEPVN